MKRKVIIVTDGDSVAQKAIEVATKNIGGRCISFSSGNPTQASANEIIDSIKSAHSDPVVVMLDDCGYLGKGKGETIMEYILNDDAIEVLGVVAVASNIKDDEGTDVGSSVNNDGVVVDNAVDKNGFELDDKHIKGDTLSILKNYDIPIIGMGDPGKMNFDDAVEAGSPITTKAFEEILRISGYES